MKVGIIINPVIRDILFSITKQDQERPIEELIKELEKYLIEKSSNNEVSVMTKDEFHEFLNLASAKENSHPIDASDNICDGLSQRIKEIRKGDEEKLTAIFKWIKRFPF